MKLEFLCLILVVLLLVLSGEMNAQKKRNLEQCSRSAECASRNCKRNRCAPLRCRNDRACLRAGLFDHYCRRRGPKVFSSECIPKRGRGQLCRRSRQCLSNKCLPLLFRCA
jgi:hypothetical protein